MPIDKLKEKLDKDREALEKAVKDVETAKEETKTIIDFSTFVIISIIWLLIWLFIYKDFTEGHIIIESKLQSSCKTHI